MAGRADQDDPDGLIVQPVSGGSASGGSARRRARSGLALANGWGGRTRTRFVSWLLLLPLCTALSGCDAEDRTGASSPRRAAAVASRSGGVPPLPEPFISTKCSFHGAVYRPHPDWADEEFDYTLKVRHAGENSGFYEAALVFEARDLRSGDLLTTLRMHHTTGCGLGRDTAYTENDALSVDVQHINRDLGGTLGEVPELQVPAAYALQFTDLERELYYRHRRWDDLGRSVTYHTADKAKPRFPNRWLLSRCGPTSRSLVAPPALGPGLNEGRSRYGLLSIVPNPGRLFQDRHRLLAFDGRILDMPDTDFLQYFGLRKAWAWGGADLFLVSGETGAKICPVLYVIVEVRSSEEVKVSKAFGTCGDVLSAQLTPHGVEVTTGPHPAALPYGPNKTFTYAKGRVTPDDWY